MNGLPIQRNMVIQIPDAKFGSRSLRPIPLCTPLFPVSRTQVLLLCNRATLELPNLPAAQAFSGTIAVPPGFPRSLPRCAEHVEWRLLRESNHKKEELND